MSEVDRGPSPSDSVSGPSPSPSSSGFLFSINFIVQRSWGKKRRL